MEKRKRFSAEFKREAVRLMRDSGKVCGGSLQFITRKARVREFDTGLC